MSDRKPCPGRVTWIDLSVADAEKTRRFYERVVGWRAVPHEMGGYSDFSMTTGDPPETVAGICHARGENAAFPPQWLIYITVSDLDAALQRCAENGGTIVAAARDTAHGRIALMQDPAGAVAALYQPQEASAT